MRSIATALTRDYLRRSAWPALATLAYLIGVPWLAYGLMRWQAFELPPEAIGSAVMPHAVLASLLVGALFVIWVGQGETFGMSRRLYALPIATWLAVACRMLQGGLTAAVLYVVTISAHDRMFGVAWPLAGPAMLLAVWAMWIQAIIWSLMHFRLWKVIGLGAVLVSLGYWTGWRFYPDGFYAPPRPWLVPSVAEIIGLFAYAAAAFAVGLEGVGRHRQGGCEGLPAWLARLERFWEGQVLRREQPFRSAEDALLWYEWTSRGVVLPVMVGGLLMLAALIGVVNVALGWGRPSDVLEVQLVIGMFGLPQLALVLGMFLGHRNVSSAKLDFDSFSATRPVSDAALAAAFFRSARRAVLLSYAVSAAICLATMGWVCWQEGVAALAPAARQVFFESSLGWWSIPLVWGAALLATWTALGLGASLVLSGRTPLLGWVVGGLFGGPVVLGILVNLLLPPAAAAVVSAASFAVFGLACLGGTAWAFTRAVGRRLIPANTAWLSLIAWLALCGAVAVVLANGPASPMPQPHYLRWLALPLVPGVLALVFAPLATAPLALAWNRHR